MNSRVLFVLALVAVAAADKRPRPTYGAPPPPPPPPQPSYSAPRPVYSAPESSEEFEPPKYNFEWEVKDEYSGNDFEHQEDRDDDNTKGSYSVQLPDGRLQRVTYYVDGDSGYIAEVTYEGEAQYPESAESRESYGPPQPSYYAPESEESEEAPVYAPPPPPRPAYAPPQPSYSPPQRTYGRPQ